jgi:feruloyl-CoA synthase
VLEHPRVVARFQAALDELAREGSGSSTFVARALLLEEPPSFDAREVTDKGSLNQKAVLAHRAALVDELYAEPPSPRVIRCDVHATVPR